MMHIHGGDAAVFIGGVVINALVRIAAAGIEGHLRLAVIQQYTASWHSNGGKQMEELADIVLFRTVG